MLHNHNCVVKVSSLDEVVAVEVLYLMEKAESAAGADLRCVINAHIPVDILHADNPGAKIHGDVN